MLNNFEEALYRKRYRAFFMKNNNTYRAYFYFYYGNTE
jgi:hypothetical protein